MAPKAGLLLRYASNIRLFESNISGDFMISNAIKVSLISLAVSAAGAHAAEVAGTVNSKGNVEVVRSGVSQSLNNTSAAYMINDQLVTSKKASASVTLKNEKPQLSIFPETKVSVNQSSPLGVALQSGTVTASFKPAQSMSINTPNSSVSAKALSAGELVMSSEGGKLAVAAKSGSFNITDANGVTRTVTAADKQALLIGQNESKMVNVAGLLGSGNNAVIAAALVAAGIITAVAVAETSDDDDDAPASPVLN